MLDFLIGYGIYGLFLASFLAATILPFSSEVVLTGCLLAGLDPLQCLIAATIGNFLGGVTTYLIGFLGKIEWAEKYLRVERTKIEQTQAKINRYGAFIAFFSFVPVVGDIIPLSLGFMRASATKTMIGMLVGKFLRYAVVIYIVGLV